ncbi:hypothetical protein DPMN_135570 [Dreissena polymorpha]|uniref:Uncharacterized protein n=1 Tax=Dreissena polymorpha TaxID=45954 RepID=A0A9D4FYA7_DREPO|nr:hypothetical protein DPMN_135570 [Dreissena polymorpha]
MHEALFTQSIVRIFYWFSGPSEPLEGIACDVDCSGVSVVTLLADLTYPSLKSWGEDLAIILLIYRRDREPNWKGHCHGGVLVAMNISLCLQMRGNCRKIAR